MLKHINFSFLKALIFILSSIMCNKNCISKKIVTIVLVMMCFLARAQSVCETPITGTVDSRVAAWQYIGAVSEGLNYALESVGGSKGFTATNGPEDGNTVYSVIYNTITSHHISLLRNRYFSNDSWYQTLTETYDNTPHSWTGLSGVVAEKAPIFGYIAFIDENGNGSYDSGAEQYIRDVVSLTIATERTGDLYMAFYDDGVYNDNSGTLTISATPKNCPVNLIYADTLIICKGDTALIEAMHMEDPIWSTDRQVTVNDSTIKAYPEQTSVYTVERTLSRKNLLVNSDFEDVNLPGTNAQLDASLVNGWNTTATDNKIEIWRDGFLGHPAYSGTFFAELNATQPSALYQDVETTEGEIIKWGFAHRGRVINETMQLKIGPVNGPYEVIGDFTDGPTAWRYYSGEYIVPAGQKDTRFLFSAVDLNAAANLIDAPSFEAVIRHQDSVIVVVKHCETDLEITKTDGVQNYERGQNTVYTIAAKNNGPIDVEGATVSDLIPVGVNSCSWTAVLYETASNSS